MIEHDWQRQEQVTFGLTTEAPQALDNLLIRLAKLIKAIDDLGGHEAATRAQFELNAVSAERKAVADRPPQQWRELYLRARRALRELAFSNPLIDFDELFFVRRHWPAYNHQCAHHVGEAQQPDADLVILKGLKGDGVVRSVLSGQLPPGGIGRADLSFDAKRIVFPYAPPRPTPTPYVLAQPGVRSGACMPYDIYEINIDGTGLRQIIDHPAEDTEPCYLPDGRIAFTSSRGGRFVQCGDWALVFSIYACDSDGANVVKLTQAKEGEWYPSMLEDGRIIYMRWEYVMKAYNTVQYLWTVYPDGTRAQLAYGDHFAFSNGPLTFIEPRQVPQTSKIITTGAAHHNAGVGPICLVDLAKNRLGKTGFANLTPEVGYPEAGDNAVVSETGWYASPWPLSEDFYIVSYNFESAANHPDGYAIYLMDTFGNKELIYRDGAMSCYCAIPLKPRRAPAPLPQAPKLQHPAKHGTVVLADIYQGLSGVKRGTVKYLRVLETHPKEVHTTPQRCDVGVASGWDMRTVLGTVPVEPDGSACFRVPADKTIFFEAIDADFLEIRRMRSFMTVADGETVSCVGCHESYAMAPPAKNLAALKKAPADITPPPWGTDSMDFQRVVQPVLDRHCIRCHDGSKKPSSSFDLGSKIMVKAPIWRDPDYGGQHNVSEAFLELLKFVDYVKVSGYDGGNLPLGVLATGSHRSRLMHVLKQGHYDVTLPIADWRALAAWIDCNAPYLGSWSDIDISKTRPETLADLPYGPQHISTRRNELSAQALTGYRLSCYIDCGATVEDTAEDGLTLRQLNGSPYKYKDTEHAAALHLAVITFDELRIAFEAKGLDPAASYIVGLTWWDFNTAGRTQTVEITGGKTVGSQILLPATRLPGYKDVGKLPETIQFALPPDFYTNGKCRITTKKVAGGNAVLSEIWIWQSKQKTPPGEYLSGM